MNRPSSHASSSPPASCRPRQRHRTPALALAAIALALGLAAGCSSDAPTTTTGQTAPETTTSVVETTSATTTTTGTSDTSTTAPGAGAPTTVTYSPPYTGTTLKDVPLPPFESNALVRELKRTSNALNAIAAAMSTEGAPESDPRSGTVYALRARAQAITARRAIVDNQLPLAAEAVTQLNHLLARGVQTAEGDTAAALAQAQEHMLRMTSPAANPLQAASTLDYVIRDLAPLVPETTTTTT